VNAPVLSVVAVPRDVAVSNVSETVSLTPNFFPATCIFTLGEPVFGKRVMTGPAAWTANLAEMTKVRLRAKSVTRIIVVYTLKREKICMENLAS
jgi:hypothetical protein